MSYQQEKFTEIADAIRAKTGTTDLIKPSEFASKVNDVFEAGKKSQYDEFWYNYQQNGQRRDYRYAFAGIWNVDLFKPKYDIRPVTNAEYMFANSQENLPNEYKKRISMKNLEKQQGIVFDFSNVTRAVRIFRQSFFRELNVIDFSKCTNIQYAFTSETDSYSIERIERLIFGVPFKHEGGQPFSSCIQMTHIGFEGTINCNTLNLSFMPLLDKESLLAFINCLVDKSTDTSGTTWYVTLGNTLLAKLTEDEIAIAESKGWQLR